MHDEPIGCDVLLFIAFAHVMQQDVVLERVGDKPLRVGIFSAVLYPVLLLGQLEELLCWSGIRGRNYQEAWCKQYVKDVTGTPEQENLLTGGPQWLVKYFRGCYKYVRCVEIDQTFTVN